MMSDDADADFDVNRFLDDVAGVGSQAVLSVFAAARMDPPSAEAVRKWRQRNSIPGASLAKLLCALEIVDGRPLSMAAHINGGADRCSNGKPSSSGSRLNVFD